ncbi:MAG: glutamate racemase [Spirochaetaceae bacterium]|jgi:glutamate racemase|nr:glutamate racemase [Spirochaetaceae bacterium]
MRYPAASRKLNIGILAAGVGGLTVLRELERLLPQEGFVYFGDSANCPYGNRSEDEITALSRRMLDFLREQGVKAAAIACNTISTLVDALSPEYDFPLFGIIRPMAEAVGQGALPAVGLIATRFTIRTGHYHRLIAQYAPGTRVYGVESPGLAALIDRGDFSDPAIGTEVSRLVGCLREAGRCGHAILGCTHYPIIQAVFEKAAPDILFLNPALEQAKAVVRFLEQEDLLNGETPRQRKIVTSGNTGIYGAVLRKLGIQTPAVIQAP